MSADRFTEVTTTSWFGRIGNAIKGMLFGPVLMGLAVLLLFWNEGRAVKRAKTLTEGAAAVTSIGADLVDPANEGRLVHLVAQAATTEVLADREFGLSANVLKLRRTAEMYQWKEHEEKKTRSNTGGSSTTTTTTTYARTWSEPLIDSSRFKHPEGHANPGTMPCSSREFVAQRITAGAFTLPPSLVNRIDNYAELLPPPTESLPAAVRSGARLVDRRIYFGADPAAPQIGDVRVSFAVVRPGLVSLVARQVNNTFEPFRSKAGGELELLGVGELSAAELIRQARQMNLLLTWALRLGGLLVMWIGLAVLFRPLSVLADFIPLLGSLVGLGAGLGALLGAAVLSVGTASVAWFYYRPVLAVAALAGTVTLAVWVARRRQRATR